MRKQRVHALLQFRRLENELSFSVLLGDYVVTRHDDGSEGIAAKAYQTIIGRIQNTRCEDDSAQAEK